MKVLILSCNTGEGHNSAGRALIEQFQQRGIACEMTDALAFFSKRASRGICEAYTQITLRTPRLFGTIYHTSEKIGSLRIRSAVYRVNSTYARRLRQYICQQGYDTVIATHIFPSEALTHMRRKYGAEFKTYFISTDYDFCPYLNETQLDGYFIPHELLRQDYVSHGLPDERVYACGIPGSEQFASRVAREEARRELGMVQEGPAALVMTGSMGFGDVGQIVARLRAKLPQAQVLVMGGNNTKLKSALREQFGKDRNVTVLDFTRQVSLYMDACDLLFTKPGGLTTTEAAIKGIPLVHTAPIPGCESANVAFFTRLGMSVSAQTPVALADTAAALLMDTERCAQMVQAQRKYINQHAARDICQKVMALQPVGVTA